jgi:hypothetical protein
MRRWLAGLPILLVCIPGCSNARVSVPISGVVQTASGQPVGGVRLILEPIEEPKAGATFGFDLDDEGHFAGEAFPGTYAFYLSTVAVERDDDDGHPLGAAEAKKLRASRQRLQKLPQAYYTARNAGPDRNVEVKSGATLSLVVK